MADFTLPELGEQIEAGDVLRVLVKPGDILVKEHPVLELETDKATIEVPSSVVGTVKEIKVKAGDKVKVGQAILSYEEGNGAKPSADDVSPKQGGAKAPAKAEAAPKQAAATTEAAKAGASGKAEEEVPDMQPDVQVKD